ncbi:hypothetical protein GUT183_00530 [Streptococcus ruminantium]|nr:hypothetical protein GUT183_00530 [Streptococcus ruminantium]
MKVLKFWPEFFILLTSLLYLTVYILNDLSVYKVPEEIISIDIPFMSLMLLFVVLIYREKRG